MRGSADGGGLLQCSEYRARYVNDECSEVAAPLPGARKGTQDANLSQQTWKADKTSATCHFKSIFSLKNRTALLTKVLDSPHQAVGVLRTKTSTKFRAIIKFSHLCRAGLVEKMKIWKELGNNSRPAWVEQLDSSLMSWGRNLDQTKRFHLQQDNNPLEGNRQLMLVSGMLHLNWTESKLKLKVNLNLTLM